VTPPTNALPDPELQRLEAAKWRPSSLGAPDNLIALFADDFVTVEYGADLHGGVERKFNAKSSMNEADTKQLIAMLDQTTFNLSEWHSVSLGPDSTLLSYKVEAPQFGWRALATSVWKNGPKGWQTVFYQASRAR
jgi:hypothetical protein